MRYWRAIHIKIGIPKEIKVHEYQVGMTPASVREAASHGHEVLVEKGAGLRIGCTDDDYLAAGARIAGTPQDVFDWNDLIVKVKEPQPQECRLLRDRQVLFTYLHLAADQYSTLDATEDALRTADLVLGAVLVLGAAAPATPAAFTIYRIAHERGLHAD